MTLPPRRRRSGTLLRHIIAWVAVAFFGFPLFWIATIACKRSSDYVRNPPVPESVFRGEAATVSSIATLPIVVATLFLQRYRVTGLALGAVK